MMAPPRYRNHVPGTAPRGAVVRLVVIALLVGAAMAATGRALDWYRDQVLVDTVGVDALLDEAALTPPGAEGLVFLPYLAGERSPIWDPEARGVLAGLTLGHGRAHISRAIVEADIFFNSAFPWSVASGPVQLGYTMTPAGDVGAIAEAGTPRTYQYDFLDRLTGSPGWLQYGYDGTGNRTSETVEGAAASYTYDGTSDQIIRKLIPGPSGNVNNLAFGYDNQTNVTAIGLYNSAGSAFAKTICLRHDPLGRVVMVGQKSSATFNPLGTACVTDAEVSTVLARFKYDSRNRRVARWLPGSGWTYFAQGPDGSVLGEAALTADPVQPWSRQQEYVWLEGRPVAQVEYPGPAGSADGYAYYFHTDHIGLPRALTNQGGQTVWSATPARPYGDLVETTATDPLSGRVVVTNLRLPGQYDERLFATIGLQGPYYNWNRWYLPGVGRYLEVDPIALAGRFNTPYAVDWYGYAAGNPQRYTDPSGLLVELYCERLSNQRVPWGAGFKAWLQGQVAAQGEHCFVRVACETCDRSFDVTLELLGPNQSPQFGRPWVENFNPSFNGRGSTRQRGVNGQNQSGCAVEQCILDRFNELSATLPPYNGTGPNSNTFAAQLLSGCGLHGDFPWRAKGSGN